MFPDSAAFVENVVERDIGVGGKRGADLAGLGIPLGNRTGRESDVDVDAHGLIRIEIHDWCFHSLEGDHAAFENDGTATIQAGFAPVVNEAGEL